MPVRVRDCHWCDCRVIVSAVWLLLVVFASVASAQTTIGTFAWQVAPYCNVVRFSVTVDGAAFRLSGFDDQCGGAQLPGAGTAVPRGDGHYGLSFYIVTPTGLVSHVTAVLHPTSISGPWSDSSGAAGTLVFGPTIPTGGSPRPAPLVPTIALAPASVTATQVAVGAIGASALADGSVTPAKLQFPFEANATSVASAFRINQSQPEATALHGVSLEGFGVYGEGYYGVHGVSTTGSGVLGITADMGGAAVLALSHGAGPGIRAQAKGTAEGALIESTNAANASDVVVIRSEGTGDLIQAERDGQVRFRVTANGVVQGDGAYTSPAADVAEFIDALDTLAPGDVVEIDPTRDGLFRRVATASSAAVAGVVTTRPGVLLNAGQGRDDLSDGPALALAGRVPVKVSAENGAIGRGDLLVASSTPGHAMRAAAAPAAGTVIGKALGSLTSGTGVIEMLVMLR